MGREQLEGLGTTGVLGLLAQGASSAYRFARVGRAGGILFGVVAPAMVGVASAVGLYRAKNVADRVDATHGLLWATQAAAWTLRHTAGWQTGAFVTATGLVGGGLQILVGAYRALRGERRNRIGGALDIAAGTAWALTAANVAVPVTMGVFIGATILKLGWDRLPPSNPLLSKRN